MRRPAIHRFQRMLAALLWLLASFAFMTRQQGMEMSGMVMGGAASQAAPLAKRPVPEPEMAQMETSAGQVGHGTAQLTAAQLSAAHDHQTKTHNANAPPAPTLDNLNQQGHAGHCPFCSTAAFALAAFSVELLAPGYVQTAHQLARIPAAPRPLLSSKRARAPPLG